VASKDGVSRDVLGDAGLIVDTGRPSALALCLADLLGDPTRYGALVAAGPAQLDRLDLAGAADRIVDLVDALRGTNGSLNP